MGAFAVDAALIVGATIALALVTIPLTAATRGLGLAVGLLAFFLLRNFYFSWFECRWHGATPGKRLLGLRVIDAHGGTLTPEAVLARNLMREVELFLPLVALWRRRRCCPACPAGRVSSLFAWVLRLRAPPALQPRPAARGGHGRRGRWWSWPRRRSCART